MRHVSQLNRIILLVVFFVAFFQIPWSAVDASGEVEPALRVAVGSNFVPVARELAKIFEDSHQTRITIIAGSTGKLYQQIKNGAPYDLFFSADSKRPALLMQQGLGMTGTLTTYAIGQAVVWSPHLKSSQEVIKNLKQLLFTHLAMAHPQQAPYGVAAREILEFLQIWQSAQGRIVRGENVGQAFQFVQSGSADFGIVALSQVKQIASLKGSYWVVPQSYYSLLRQSALILKRTRYKESAVKFMSLVKGDQGRQLIQTFGYSLEEN